LGGSAIVASGGGATSTGTVTGETGGSTIVASDGRTTDGSLAGGFVDMGGKPGRAKELFRIGSGITKGSGGTRSGMDDDGEI